MTSGAEAPFSARTAWSRSVRTPLREFLRTETGGAAVLLAAAVAALVWVNVDSSSYTRLWAESMEAELSIELQATEHPMNLGSSRGGTPIPAQRGKRP